MGASPHHHGVEAFRVGRSLVGAGNPAGEHPPLGKAKRAAEAHAETVDRQASATPKKIFAVLRNSGRSAADLVTTIVDFVLFLPLLPIIGLQRRDEPPDAPAADEAAACGPQAAADRFDPIRPPFPHPPPESAND
jgi:hypothetical protein